MSQSTIPLSSGDPEPREAGSSCTLGQQVGPAGFPAAKTGLVLQGERLRRLVRDLSEGTKGEF